MRTTLLCTVGTSLFESNLKRLSHDTPNKPSNWEAIRQAYDAKQWKALARELLAVNPRERVCGAEINTIAESLKKKWLALENLIFFVSDTEIGEQTGKVLCEYFTQRHDLKLGNVEYVKVTDLQDVDPNRFKRHGLLNLVRELGEYIQKYGAQNVAIDATGGYKAQIAIAVVMGQALNIPVFYKHELFSEIINFPPLPISLDFDLLGRYADLLRLFEQGGTYTSSEMGGIDERIRVFLDEVVEGNETLYAINAMGTIYLTIFRLRYPKKPELRPAHQNERKEPTFGKHHLPHGFEEFVTKVWRDTPWIITCRSQPYHGQRSIGETGFFVESRSNNTFKLIGHYKGSGHPERARFEIDCTDESSESLNWAAYNLNRTFVK